MYKRQPVVISKLAKSYDGFIAIGCIVKGETANFDLISKAITNGIMEISISQKKPIGNAVITSFNREQALKRSEVNFGSQENNNIGYNVANAAIEISC